MLTDRRVRTSLVAILADLILTFLKLVLAIWTGSAALLADAYHSGTDLLVSVILLLGIIFRFKQEKKEDPSAVSRAKKVESVLAAIVSLLILYVPFEILSEVRQKEHAEISHIWLGILGTLAVIAIVYFMAKFKTHVGRETDSQALEADGYHSMVDVFSSIAVLISLVGFLVGIYLDEIIAVLIAIMIAISGVELLVSAIRSLVRGSDFDQLSLFDLLQTLVSKIPFGQFFFYITRATKTWFWRSRYPLAIGLVGLYLASGFTAVPHGFVGIHTRLSEAKDEVLNSGLHYILPWPIDGYHLVEADRVYSVTVGSRIDKGVFKDESRLWQGIKVRAVHQESVPYLLTGDEQLVDSNITVHYRISDPFVQAFHFNELHDLVGSVINHALTSVTAMHSFDTIFRNDQAVYAEEIKREIDKALNELEAQVQVANVNIESLKPPALVINSYRDVNNANQEKHQRMNRAVTQKYKDLPKAQADYQASLADAYATRKEAELIAQGNVERMSVVAEVHADSPTAFEFNTYINTIERALQNRQLMIKDEALNVEELRLWLNLEEETPGKR